MNNRKLTIIESPFSTDRSGEYLRRCLADSWSRGELPFASHAFFPQWLDEDNQEDRRAGIAAGYEFWQFAERVVFYVDHGMSEGMQAAYERLTFLPVRLAREMRTLTEETRHEDAEKNPGR